MDDTSGWVVLLSFSILLVFFLLLTAFWFSYWFTNRVQGLSPYTGLPLRRASELSFFASQRVLHLLNDLHQYDNRPFELNRASFCRETGRIFPDSITLFDTIRVDWNFLQKRYPGTYVSWGSLSKEQQQTIRDSHESLWGFQTEQSSPDPIPRAIDSTYAYIKPGPLYVDLETQVLVGWKEVPDTNLEVLIVQKPIDKFANKGL
jgi:hypothetical protein